MPAIVSKLIEGFEVAVHYDPLSSFSNQSVQSMESAVIFVFGFWVKMKDPSSGRWTGLF